MTTGDLLEENGILSPTKLHYGNHSYRSSYDFLSSRVIFPLVDNNNSASVATSKSKYYTMKSKNLIKGEGLQIPKQASGPEIVEVWVPMSFLYETYRIIYFTLF
jgi:hypothetical protein